MTLDAYGCDMDAFARSVETAPLFDVTGPGMAVMSVLSDAQELLAMGRAEEARQYINRAKFLIHHFNLGPPAPR